MKPEEMIKARIEILISKRESLLSDYLFIENEDEKNVAAAVLIEKEFAIRELKWVLE